MDATSLHTLAQWASGTLSQGEPGINVMRVCTDSRALMPGDFFVALRGENFDGHAFVEAVARQGAAAAMVDLAYDVTLPSHFPLLRVRDTLIGLQAIAKHYRAGLPLRVIGITGSNGKTSTKDFTAAVLSQKYRVIKTEGNLNNHIGLPLSILQATSSDEIGVFEMGMNHPGEIAPLAAIAAPDIAIITNIGMAHIEFLKTRAAIAKEKGMLAEALSSSGYLILNARDEFSEAIAARTSATTVLVGINSGEVQAAVHEIGFNGSRIAVQAGRESMEFTLPIPGRHMIENALLAIAAGRICGVPLSMAGAGLVRSRITAGRLEMKNIRGIHFLDDSYNANPDSMGAALRTLVSLPLSGKRIAVLGRMGELGKESERGHRSVGKAAARSNIDLLITVGEEAAMIGDAARDGGLKEVIKTPDTAAAAEILSERAHPGDVVLIKGSRSSCMERILAHPAFLIAAAAF